MHLNKEYSALVSAVKGKYVGLSGPTSPDGYAMPMSPNKDETAVHGCHWPGDMAVRMRKILAITRGLKRGVCASVLRFIFGYNSKACYEIIHI